MNSFVSLLAKKSSLEIQLQFKIKLVYDVGSDWHIIKPGIVVDNISQTTSYLTIYLNLEAYFSYRNNISFLTLAVKMAT